MDNTQNQNEQASDGNEQTHTVVIYGELGDGPQTQVVILDETMWLTQRQMSTLFNVSVPTINAHLKNVFESRELDETSVIRNFLITATDGKKYNTKHYSLDAIISVGYRVNSAEATRFRIWATKILKEYIVKGFALDDKRLKQGKQTFGQDYFRELLQRVRSIRASEAQIWRQVTDIFITCSIDYDKGSPTTRNFLPEFRTCFITPSLGKPQPK